MISIVIFVGLNNSSKKSYNSSRSGSPTSIAESTTSNATPQLSKQLTSKLPQFQMNSNSSNNMAKDSRKIGLAKINKSSIPHVQVNSGTSLSKLTNQKVQQSSSTFSNNSAIKQNSDKSK